MEIKKKVVPKLRQEVKVDIVTVMTFILLSTGALNLNKCKILSFSKLLCQKSSL